MIPTGKGFYVWKMDRCGDVAGIAQAAKEAGLGHVIVKIADGTDISYNPGALAVDYILELNDIETWGYQYVYLANPEAEARAVVKRIVTDGCFAGLILDVEKECKNKPEETKIYCDTLRVLLPTFPIGLASYRYPHYHPEIAWKTWRSICDFDMPQVYWQLAHNPAGQLLASLGEFEKMTPSLPYVPTGSAYSEYDWKATPADIAEFVLACGELGLTSYNFWELYEARTENPELWEVIVADGEPEPEPEPIPGELLFEALVDGQNVRTGPSLNYPIIGHLSVGQILAPSDIGGSDCWIEISPGQWAAVKIGLRQYLKRVND